MKYIHTAAMIGRHNASYTVPRRTPETPKVMGVQEEITDGEEEEKKRKKEKGKRKKVRGGGETRNLTFKGNRMSSTGFAAAAECVDNTVQNEFQLLAFTVAAAPPSSSSR